MANYQKIIRDYYGGNVELTCQELQRSMINKSNPSISGNDLAHIHCQIYDCNGRESSSLNRTINSLPIYFIVAHGSIDLEFQRKSKKLTLKNINSLFQEIPINPDVAQCKFLVNTTTAGGWGLLDEKTSCIAPDHLLKSSGLAIRNHFFNPNGKGEDRIAIWEAQETVAHGRGDESLSTKYPALFNIPGTKYIDKPHQFGSDRLTGGGFGIIKINQQSGTSAFNAVKRWESNKGSDPTSFTDNVYFLTDTGGDIASGNHSGITIKDVQLYQFLQSKWSEELYADGTTMYASNVLTSDIIRLGEPGIYISLTCAEYSANIPGRAIDISDPNSPDVILASSITHAFQTIGALNRELWDQYCKGLQYAMKRFRGETDEPASAQMLSGVENYGLQGPHFIAQVASARKGGKKHKKRKRKTCRKRKTRRKRKTKRRGKKPNKK